MLPPALAEQADGPGLLQREVQQLVGPVLLGQALAEVREDAVVEAWVLQLHAQGVLEADAVPHGLGGLPVGQLQQELQDRYGRQPGGRQARLTVPGIPLLEVIVAHGSLRWSRIAMALMPLGLLARATCTVSSGATQPVRGRTHISGLAGRGPHRPTRIDHRASNFRHGHHERVNAFVTRIKWAAATTSKASPDGRQRIAVTPQGSPT